MDSTSVSMSGGLGAIYMGAAIELASERAVLASIVNQLDRAHAPYVIFANVQIGGRQLDCIVATAEVVTV
ncbi:hypothetical protein, partial [Xanthobacter autotrophicus]|uniref:hypothetical protein n=1 Tax=Xanthobacter autotrophicus TaxID=280 RepID=UPI003727D810